MWSEVKLATIVKGDSKAPFSIATTPRGRGERYSFPWISPLYPLSVPYNAVLSKGASSTIFKVFGMTWPGIEPRSPGPLANTLTIMPSHSHPVELTQHLWCHNWGMPTGPNIFHTCHTSLNSCAVPTIKWPCAGF